MFRAIVGLSRGMYIGPMPGSLLVCGSGNEIPFTLNPVLVTICFAVVV